jgi:hypothetical protein
MSRKIQFLKKEVCIIRVVDQGVAVMIDLEGVEGEGEDLITEVLSLCYQQPLLLLLLLFLIRNFLMLPR